MMTWRDAKKELPVGDKALGIGEPVHKALSLSLKEGAEGDFVAKIATFDTVDKEDDVLMPGAVDVPSDVFVSAYQHMTWRGALPIGEATLKAAGGDLIADGKFWLDTAGGAETHKVAKRAGNRQQWSYGFRILEAHFGEIESRSVRYLDRVEPYEISPVLLGAGVNTGTLAMKDLAFGEHLDALLAEAAQLVERTQGRVAFRGKDGRGLSSANRERLGTLLGTLETLHTQLKALLTAPEGPKPAAVDQVFLEFLDVQRQLASV